MRKSSILKWAAALLCLILFLLLAAFYEQCAPIDQGVYFAVSTLISAPMTFVMKLFSALASPIVLVLIGAAAFFGLRRTEYRLPLLFNLAVAVLLNLGLKSNFTRLRPSGVLVLATETGYSFPSGHAMAAMAFYGFLIYLIRKLDTKPKRKNALTALLSLVILLVGVSRIYLGVHFFTDVLGGYCASFAYLVIITSMIGRYVRQGKDERTVEAPNRKNGSLRESFGHAFDGIFSGLRNERNMVIHFVAMILVIAFGIILKISAVEWMVCCIAIGVVIAAELINTAIEAAVDLSTDKLDPRAKLAKDAAAGAVLMLALGAAAAGLIIFVPKLYDAVMQGIH